MNKEKPHPVNFVEQNVGQYGGAHELEENFSALSTPFI